VFGGVILALAQGTLVGPSIRTLADVALGVAQVTRVGGGLDGGIAEVEVLLTLGSDCWLAHGTRFPSSGTGRGAITPAVLPATETA
jgi:hypothetical protein